MAVVVCLHAPQSYCTKLSYGREAAPWSYGKEDPTIPHRLIHVHQSNEKVRPHFGDLGIWAQDQKKMWIWKIRVFTANYGVFVLSK